jgi:hypothetical protein
MKVLNFILLFLTHVIIANAQQEIRKEYDPQNQYYNYSNRLNVDNGIIEVKGKNNELIRKIYLSSNKSEHYNILTAIADSFFLQQNYKKCPQPIRLILSNLIFFNIGKEQADQIHDELLNISKKRFAEILDFCFVNDHDWVCIRNRGKKKIYKMFDEVTFN